MSKVHDDERAQVLTRLRATVAELVAWYGEESNGDYLKRIGRAETALIRLGGRSELEIQRRMVRAANE